MLLTDAQLLCGLVEGGATIQQIVLVDNQYDVGEHRGTIGYDRAIAQLATFFAPASCITFNAPSKLLHGSLEADVIVACDAGEAISRGLPRLASALLAEGGIAATLMNGGRYGSTTRAWIRPDTRREDPQPLAMGRSVVEIEVPREADAGPPFPPHMAW